MLVQDALNQVEDMEYSCSYSISSVSALLIEFDAVSERSNAGDTTILIST